MNVRRRNAHNVFTVVLAGWMAVVWSGQPTLAQTVADDAGEATRYVTQIERSLMAIEDGRREMPRDRWDPQYVVDTVGIEAGDLFGFVRDNVEWVPYRGSLRGPVGVLMDRRGNALDQTLLLADLLARAGMNVRLAHAVLPDEAAGAVWDDMAAGAAPLPPEQIATPDVPVAPDPPDDSASAPETDASPPLTTDAPGGLLFAGDASVSDADLTPGEAAELYELDEAAAMDALSSADRDRQRIAAELNDRVIEQGGRLMTLFGSPDPSAQRNYEQSRAFAALADHWWVQASEAGTWIDYDVMGGEPGQALTAAEETMRPDELPPEMRHRVVLRVVVEQLKDGRLSEATILDHEMTASELIGKRVALRHLPLLWPADWAAVTPDDVQEKLFAALRTQREWMPALTVGDEAFQQSSIKDTGEVNPDPQPQSNPFLALSFPAAGKVGRIVDIFDESFNDMLPEGERPVAEPGEVARTEGELTAEWLEYTILVPGEEPKVTRREIFDLLGPALRRSGDFSTFRMNDDKVLARAGGEMIETDIVILPSWPAPEFLADMTARVALANKPLLEEFTRDPFGKAPPNSIELFSKMTSVAGPAYLYFSLRSDVALTSGAVFVDRPQIVAQHGLLARVAPGELTARVALDVVENGVGVDPFVGDAFMVRLLQGVADTNAEALALPDGGENVGAAFEEAVDGDEWTIFFPEDERFVASLGLPADTSERLVADLRAGNVVISPSVDASDVERTGWWRVDPVSGATLGMGNRGWGSVLVEYAFYLTIQVMMAQIACMAYKAAAQPRINQLTAEQGRDRVKRWAGQCVSQALLQSLTGMSTAWIQSRFIYGYRSASRGPSTWRDPGAPGARSKPSGSLSGQKSGPASAQNSKPPANQRPQHRKPRTETRQDRNSPSNRPKRDQPKPRPQDRKKAEPCRADAGFVKFAYAGGGMRFMSDLPSPFLLAAAPGCPPPPKRNDAEAAKKVEKLTREHEAARAREADAARNYFDNPSPENRQRFEQAEVARQEAGWRELEAWKREGGSVLPPGFKSKPLPSPPSDWDTKRGYRTGGPGPVDPYDITRVDHNPPGSGPASGPKTSPGSGPPPGQRGESPKQAPGGSSISPAAQSVPPPPPISPAANSVPPPPSNSVDPMAETQKPGPRDTIVDHGGDTLAGKEAGPGYGPSGTLVMGLGALTGAIRNGP